MTGIWVLVGTLVAAVAVGAALRWSNGRIRAGHGERPGRVLPERVAAELSPEAAVTLVQVSTTFCAPCRRAKGVLSDLAEATEGLRHVELDVTDEPDLARDLGVLRTPTTLALTRSGEELLRVSGVPNAADLLESLKPQLSSQK